ncbi:MAG: Spy/CpxP family protein refolding chaperone [Pseudomonadota bacterium]
MNQHQDSTPASPAVPKRSSGRRWIFGAALIAAVGATGLAGASFAGDGDGFGGMHGMHGARHHAMDPASMAKHIEHMIAKVAPDATPQQKARLTEIAQSAFNDLKPMRAQFHEAHKRAHELLTQPTIDRAALEALRVEQVQHFDACSKRILAAVEEAADILTPEQRARFAEHMQKRMQHH